MSGAIARKLSHALLWEISIEIVHSAFAILTDREFKQVEELLMYLPTAGLCVRKAAWEKFIQKGVRLQLTGRRGETALGWTRKPNLQ